MLIDPTVLLLYKAALVAVILLCATGSLYGLSRIGSAKGISGITGFMTWAVTDGKSYGLAIVGFVATAAYAFEYLSWDHWIIVMGFVNGTAIGTLRASQGKTIQEVKNEVKNVTAVAPPKKEGDAGA